MKLRMLANFKNLMAGQIITAPDDQEFRAWLITRQYAEPCADEPQQPQPAAKRSRKK